MGFRLHGQRGTVLMDFRLHGEKANCLQIEMQKRKIRKIILCDILSKSFCEFSCFRCVSVAFPLRFRCVSVAFPLRFRCVSVAFPLRFRCVSVRFSFLEILYFPFQLSLMDSLLFR